MEIIEARKAILKEILEPYIILLRISLPMLSVPKRNLVLGGSRESPTVSIGSYGAIRGAKIAISDTTIIITAPEIAIQYSERFSLLIFLRGGMIVLDRGVLFMEIT